ncbi:MAG: hypothetical protein U0263_33325 [Polyangiaceae bacterium]
MTGHRLEIDARSQHEPAEVGQTCQRRRPRLARRLSVQSQAFEFDELRHGAEVRKPGGERELAELRQFCQRIQVRDLAERESELLEVSSFASMSRKLVLLPA